MALWPFRMTVHFDRPDSPDETCFTSSSDISTGKYASFPRGRFSRTSSSRPSSCVARSGIRFMNLGDAMPAAHDYTLWRPNIGAAMDLHLRLCLSLCCWWCMGSAVAAQEAKRPPSAKLSSKAWDARRRRATISSPLRTVTGCGPTRFRLTMPITARMWCSRS